jgi:hypothetical protein
MANLLGSLVASFNLPERWTRRWPWLPFFVGAGIVLAWMALADGAAIFGPIVATDLEQGRANTTLPVPNGEFQIQQSFYARWDGMQEIEIIFARASEAASGENGRLFLQLLDEASAVVAEQALQSRTLAHNQSYTFRFPVQTHSAGRGYILQLAGNSENPVTVWGYTLDSYSPGELMLSEANGRPEAPPLIAREMRFVTHYQLQWTDAILALGTMLYREGPILLLALALIPLPGMLLLLIPGGRRWRWEPAAWWGTAYALGIAGWSLLWSGLTLLGARWSGWSLWLFFGAGWATALAHWIRKRRGHGLTAGGHAEIGSGGSISSFLKRPVAAWRWQHAVLPVLMLAALAVRFLAIRDLAFPAWVDSSRHALITAAMAEQGRTLSDYAPFLPVERVPYHYGFHTLSASLLMMTGWPLPRLLLFLGQLLNGMLPLTVYAAAWLTTRRRDISLLAAFLVALPFFFPAYYATWGRLTQLTAMFLLPILLAFTWLLVRGGRGWRRGWWMTGLLAAGLFLVHIRVFLFYLPFAAIVWMITFGRNGRRLLAAAALALALAAPRIVQLGGMMEPSRLFDSNIANYNAFPTSYVQVGWERQFIGVAFAGLLLVMVSGLRRQRWTVLPLALAGWVGLLFLLLAGERLGLPETSLVNLNSMYISLFLPLALFLAITMGSVWRWWRQSHWLPRRLGAAVVGAALSVSLLFGLRQQVNILNPQTILARYGDLAGLQWASENLPDSAVIAVNSWLWLGQTWAGSDGGAWIVPLTGRASSTPPIDYIYDSELRTFVSEFNSAATGVSDWRSVEAVDWLRQQGVSHVYVGPRGGFFEPATLAQNPGLRLIFSRDGVFIFELKTL